jgi:PIN domain nuclease of toxin-antitoxin system
MLCAVADTHAIIWYIFADARLSKTAVNTFEQIATEGNQIAFSSITLAEIVYLSERGRINVDTLKLLLEAINKDNALLVEIPFDQKIAKCLKQVDRTQIPELCDRIIAATGVYLNVPIISRDHKIQMSDLKTIW